MYQAGAGKVYPRRLFFFVAILFRTPVPLISNWMSHGHPAVDVNGLAGYVGGLVAGQIGSQRRDLLRFADPSHGLACDHHFQGFLGVRGLAHAIVSEEGIVKRTEP